MRCNGSAAPIMVYKRKIPYGIKNMVQKYAGRPANSIFRIKAKHLCTLNIAIIKHDINNAPVIELAPAQAIYVWSQTILYKAYIIFQLQ